MLNDTMSLVVALYAIKVSTDNPWPYLTLNSSIKVSKRSADSKHSYGWHRAEVIAALVNGVFLLALCFSIIMEALERFAHPPGLVMICPPLNSIQ
jgi:zinc transporter 1